jgi:hypothetical protein
VVDAPGETDSPDGAAIADDGDARGVTTGADGDAPLTLGLGSVLVLSEPLPLLTPSAPPSPAPAESDAAGSGAEGAIVEPSLTGAAWPCRSALLPISHVPHQPENIDA